MAKAKANHLEQNLSHEPQLHPRPHRLETQLNKDLQNSRGQEGLQMVPTKMRRSVPFIFITKLAIARVVQAVNIITLLTAKISRRAAANLVKDAGIIMSKRLLCRRPLLPTLRLSPPGSRNQRRKERRKQHRSRRHQQSRSITEGQVSVSRGWPLVTLTCMRLSLIHILTLPTKRIV